jgi:hypothetical protein
VLRLNDCRLGRTGAVSLAEASQVELNLEGNDIQEGGVRALAETLRLNTTITELQLGFNALGLEQESALRQGTFHDHR